MSEDVLVLDVLVRFGRVPNGVAFDWLEAVFAGHRVSLVNLPLIL